MRALCRAMLFPAALALGGATVPYAQVTSSPVAPSTADTGPVVVFHVLPTYPQIALAARVSGFVLLEVAVGVDGRVVTARVMRSIPLLDQAALDAIRRWRFTPVIEPEKVSIGIRFEIDDPALHPRPASFREALPFWVSPDFAFTYRYQCRGATIEIDSITRTITRARNRIDPHRQFAFSFERDDAAAAFLLLTGAGVFDANFRTSHVWSEKPAALPAVMQTGPQITVTVALPVPVVDVQSAANQIQWVGGDQPRLRSAHTLSVRRSNRWRQYDWSQPVDSADSDEFQALANAGRRLRELVKKNLTNATDVPMCW